MSNQSSNQNQNAANSKPGQQEQAKGDGNLDVNNLDEEQRLADEYTEDGLDEVPAHLTNNPNRNHDKVDIDKPPYS